MSGTGTGGPYLYLDGTGTVVPDTSDILEQVQGEYKAALGQDISVDPETPQGVLITAETEARSEVTGNNAALANQINPNIAGGVFLYALCALTGFDPPAATNSLVPGVTVTGVPLSIIPASSQARTDAGDIFQTAEAVTLDAGGRGTVDFESLQVGPITCPIGSLRFIVTPVLGWETVVNSAPATLGTTPPTDAQLRTLRLQTLALQGVATSEAVFSNVRAVKGVLSMTFRENVTSSTQTIDGISLVAKSIWACVDGGVDVDIAQALLLSKSGGCQWNGAVTVGTLEPNSGQIYNVKFDRPTAVTLKVQITVKLPGNVANSDDVVQALLDYAAGLISGQQGFVVGGPASPWDMASAVISEIPGTYVKSLLIATTGGFAGNEIVAAVNQKFSLAPTNIAVSVTT